MSLVLAMLLVGPAEARPRGEAAVEVQPDLADPQVRLAAQLDLIEGLLKAEMPHDALRVARELRAQGVDHWRLDLLQARALQRLGVLAEAIPLAESATRRAPRAWEAWSALGVMYADARRLDEAVEALKRALRLHRDDPGLLNNLGYVQMVNGAPEEAVELFQASLALDPTSSQTRNNLGFALARLERDTEALDAFRAAGSEAEARYNLGVACELRKDTASALTQYQAALSARPDFPQARSALDRLLATEPSP